MIAKITGTLINNNLWIPVKNSGENVAIIGNVDDFKKYVLENLGTPHALVRVQRLDDIRGKTFIGWQMAGIVHNHYEILAQIESRIK